MGGTGPGHKSVEATQARLINIQKARAARKRAPLPWRSGMESRVIEQLVWQWWIAKDSGQWTVNSGQKNQKQVPHHHPAIFSGDGAYRGHTGWVRDDNVRSSGQWTVNSGQKKQQQISHTAGVRPVRNDKLKKPWAKYRVARLLGVSHTWVNKLVKRFEADPDRMRRKMAAFAPANLEKLERAREETRRQRELGWLRGPIRYRRVKVKLYGKERKVRVPTRRTVISGERSVVSEQRQMRQKQQSVAPVRYAELPAWASGLGLPGTAGGRGPRPVKFAVRRRR